MHTLATRRCGVFARATCALSLLLAPAVAAWSADVDPSASGSRPSPHTITEDGALKRGGNDAPARGVAGSMQATDAMHEGAVAAPDLRGADPCAAFVFPYSLTGNTPAELIQAIQCAQANGPGSDTIDLAGNTITLTAAHALVLGSGVGLPPITTAVAIRNGSITRSGSALFRHFLVDAGNLTLDDVTLSNADSQSDGGSIFLFGAATLTLNRCRLIGNHGNFGGAIFVAGAANATLNHSLVAGNRANSPGGGIRNRGTLVLNNSTVAANFTTAGTEGGGGIANNGGSVTLNNSIVFGNEASSFSTDEVSGAYASNSSLVGVDPGFVQRLDAGDTAPTSAGNYRLRHFSVAVDAGNNALVPVSTASDLDGAGRFFDDLNVADTGAGTAPLVDLGPYEKRSHSVPPQADLSISKTDSLGSVLAGSATTYTLVVANAGPDDAPATVADSFPPTLGGITWTCTATGGASCTPAGSGSLIDSVALPAGSSLTYSVDATIDPAAGGLLANTATVAIGGGVTDPQGGNDTATDTTTVIALPLLTVDDVTELEGNGGSRSIRVTVRLSAPAPVGGVDFDIATVDDSATAGTDYVARALSAQQIPAGSTSYEFEVTVDGDARVEPDEAFLVDVANVSRARVSDPRGRVALVNDDVAGVTVTPGSLGVGEGGANASYGIALTSEPSTSVTVTVTGDAQVTATPSSLVFTAADWHLARTVTVQAVDDAQVEGPHAGMVSHLAAGGEYAGLPIANLTVDITDDDAAGLSLTQSAGTTAVSESGAQDSVSVVLDAQPASEVTLTLQPDEQLQTEPATLVFDPSTWNLAQTVSLRAVDDALAEGDHAGSVTFAVDSADAAFDGLALAPLLVAIADDDTVAVRIEESEGGTAVSEAGVGDSYTVALATEPLGDVSIGLAGDAQVQAAPALLVFTPADWNLPRTVTVHAVDDTLPEGPHAGRIIHTASGADYEGVAIPDVTVEIGDDDFTIGGSVSGLRGPGLVLQNNGGDDLAIDSDGVFTFSQVLSDGDTYAVTVSSQPTHQHCVASDASGTVVDADVTRVRVVCGDLALALSPAQIEFGAIVAGIRTARLTLRNVGSGDLVLASLGAPTAPFTLAAGSCLALPHTLGPEAQCDVEVRFAPEALGSYSDHLTITSNAAGSPHQVTLSGSLAPMPAPVRVPAAGPWGLLLLASVLALLGSGQVRAVRSRRR